MSEEILKAILIELKIIKVLLQNNHSEIKSPNYVYGLTEFKDFDWSQINSIVKQSDQFGAAVVQWNGFIYYRRSPDNVFAKAIWFSRCTGKDESGKNIYERLITFKEKSEVKAISREVERILYN